MTQIDVFSWAIGYFSGIVISVIMAIIAYISKDKGIPKDPDPLPPPTSLDDTIKELGRIKKEIDNLKKQMK